MPDRRVPAHARVVLGAAIALLALQVAHVLGLAQGDTGEALVDRWAYGAVPFLATLAIGARAVLVREQRLAWGLAAGGAAMWAVGDLAWLTVYHEAGGSPADEICFLLYPALYASLLLRSREAAPRPPRSLW